MADNDEVITTLNNLIETCRDGQNGFRAAAEGVANGELKELFLDYSRQRASFVGELQDEVRRLGGDPEKTGSLSAALHRGWINIKSAVTGADESAIITECERGEDSAVSNYSAALDSDLPANVRTLVERQFARVKSAHDRVRALERASGATS
ncbi:MAG TPA: PA2169 family four-helix-bundle protein [Pyrinomonadaceae bacterium]|nr:PA2169 family four-helix-bundle protein [Pyrinomonadaceae bacterium]